MYSCIGRGAHNSRVDEKRTTIWPWIFAVLIGSPVLYAASFGPACWITSRTDLGYSALPVIYAPMTWAMARSEKCAGVIRSYACLGAEPSWSWFRIKLPSNKVRWEWTHVTFTGYPCTVGTP